MTISLVTAICRAVGAAFSAAADSLAHSGTPQSVSAPEPARDTPAPSEPADSIMEQFRAGLEQALREAPPEPQPRRRKRKEKPLFDAFGNILSDWTTETGIPCVSQATTGRLLNMSRHYVARLEAEDRLTRMLRADDLRKAYYPVEQVAELIARLQLINAGTTTPPPSDDDENVSER